MIKRWLLLLILVVASSFAKNFDQFLKEVINNSRYINSLNIDLQKSAINKTIINRYENPTLELEYSKFNPNVGSVENGSRVSISQPIRLFNVSKDRNRFANSIYKNSLVNYKKDKATYIYQLCNSFIEYAKAKELYLLTKEELNIAKNILKVFKTRYKNGVISYDKFLQAKSEYQNIIYLLKLQKIAYKERYFDLLNLAGYKKRVNLNHKYNFKLAKYITISKNYQLKVLKSLEEVSKSKMRLYSNKIENIVVNAEYEKESEQKIARISIALEIPIFNNKQEEVELAKLDVLKSKLLYSLQKDRVKLTIKKLKEKIVLLKEAIKNVKSLLNTEKKLLKLLKDANKIATLNILEIEKIKNNYIRGEKSLINLRALLNQTIVTLNYIAGEIHE